MTKVEYEKGFSEAVEGPGEKFAHIVSVIANPLFVAVPTFFIIALATSLDIISAFLWWIVAVLGISIAPLLFIRRGVATGRISDPHVSVREQRFFPLVFGLGSILIAFILLLFLHASRPLIATMTAVLIVLIMATMITRVWKISLHLVGIAGAVTVFVLIFGPPFLALSPLVLLVGWARWQVRAHSPLQALAGTVLAVSVTLAIFWLFGLR